jgi:CubicO group peptidase (beta-lactamase class C family)
MNRRSFMQTTGAFCLPSLRGFASPIQNSEGIHPPTKSFLDTLPRLMELSGVPGVGIGVVRRGEAAWQYFAGVSNSSTKTPVAEDSLFPAASLSKQPFAVAVLRLMDEGNLDLDHPLNQYLSDDPITGPDGDRVTARHILSHSSGLPNWRRSAKDPLLPAFPPGNKFRYSGEGFYHLQRVVETITGTGFEAFMQSSLLIPLKMNSSTYLWSATAKDHLVAGHNNDGPYTNTSFAMTAFSLIDGSGEPLSSWNHTRIVEAVMQKQNNPVTPAPNDIVPNAAASLLTTVGDYTKFLTAFLDAQSKIALAPATREAMLTPVTRINSALSWGLGIGTEEVGGRSFLWQWGDNGGWKNFVLVHPATRTGIVVFTNGSKGEHVYQRIIGAASGIDHPAFMWV